MVLPVVSITAPQCSLEQLERELAELSEAEREQLEREQRGISIPTFVETEDARRRGLEQMREALDGISDKGDYERALQEAPRLVEKESDPFFFLRMEQYNPWEAALTLTKYWKIRVRLFKERALLPLTMTTTGALTEADVQRMRGGAIQVLPSDNSGRLVIYIRRSAVDTSTSRDRESAIPGIVGILDTQGVGRQHLDGKFSRLAGETAIQVPIKVQVGHVLFPSNRCIGKLVFPLFLWAIGPERRKRVVAHVGNDPEGHLKVLQEYGFRAEGLPPALGGTYDIDSFQQFLNSQLRKDEAKMLE